MRISFNEELHFDYFLMRKTHNKANWHGFSG